MMAATIGLWISRVLACGVAFGLALALAGVAAGGFIMVHHAASILFGFPGIHLRYSEAGIHAVVGGALIALASATLFCLCNAIRDK